MPDIFDPKSNLTTPSHTDELSLHSPDADAAVAVAKLGESERAAIEAHLHSKPISAADLTQQAPDALRELRRISMAA